MGKIIKEYETKYNVGDVVIFKKGNGLEVGIIEGYYLDDGNFWFNIRISPQHVYTYSNGGDVAEWHILGIVDDNLKQVCMNHIVNF